MIMKSVRTQQSTDFNFKARVGLPRLVIAGETNSGKTSLVNFLLRSNLLPTDIVANTRRPTFLRYARTVRANIHKPDGSNTVIALGDIRHLDWENVEFIEVNAPNAVLRRFEILDLPGLASSSDAEDKKRWVSPSDILIWCSPATQTWKASEQAIWLGIDHPKASSFLALTHRDLLSHEQFSHVAERITREAPRFFMNWSAIATTQAIATRQASGKTTKKEMRSSTGMDDFMRKLINLLQGVTAQGGGKDQTPPATPQANPGAGIAPQAVHPLQEFAQLRKQAENELENTSGSAEAARILSGKLSAYSEGVLRTWILSKGRTASQAKHLESLFNIKEDELNRYLESQQYSAASFTASQILQQLAGELGEILTSIETRRS